jgi:hypothetical protein
MNLPDYQFLSAPLWLINTLHHITLTLHFVAMNFLVGGLATILFGKFTNRWQHPVVQQFVKLLPTAMAATVTFGVAPLLFVQLVYHRQVYSTAIISGWLWLMIIPVVIVAYYLLYGASFGTSVRKGLYLGLALAGFGYVSLVYSSVFSLAENPVLAQSVYAENQSGMVLNPNVGEYLFRWLHMLFGAVTVGGFFVGWIGRDNEAAFNVGRQFFLWGMAVASLFGLVYLFTLGEALVPLMRTPGIWALTLGIVLSVGSLHFYFKKRFVPAAAMVFVSMLMMVYTRHHLRLVRLADHFDPTSVPVKMQWSFLLLFLVCFVIAVGVVWYMIRLFLAPADKN